MARSLETRAARRLSACLVPLAASLALAGCGNGGADDPPNRVPQAVADSRTVAWNAAATVDVAANDTDPDGDKLTVTAVDAPARGSAAVAAGGVVYTPTPGAFGADAFTYTVADGRGGTAQARVDVKVQASVTLSGQAIDAPLAGATVTVKVGDAATTVVADGEGRWSVPLTLDDPDALVTLTAQGTGTQSAVRLVSVAGSATAVASLVDAVGSVSSERLGAARITQVTTALAALTAAANGGAMPTSATAWDAARARTDPVAVVEMAAAIKAVADGGQPLPAGVADTFALVSDPARYATWFAALPKGVGSAYATALAATGSDAALRVEPSAVPTAASPTVVYDFVSAPACCAGFLQSLELRADGTARLDGRASTWTRSDGAIVVTYDAPVVQTFFSAELFRGAQVEGTFTTRGTTVRIVTGDAAGGVAVIGPSPTQFSVRWADPAYMPPAEDPTTTTRYFVDTARTAPAASALAGHAYAGLRVPRSDASLGDSDTAEFAADRTGRLRRTGATFTWAVGADGLVLTHAGGAVQTVRIAPSAPPEQRWEVVDSADGTRPFGSSSQDLIVPADTAPPALTTARLAANPWLYDFTPPFYYDTPATIAFRPDGTGTRFGAPMTWAVVGGKLELRHTSSPTVLAETWELLADTGDALYFWRVRWVRSGVAQYHRVVRLDKAG